MPTTSGNTPTEDRHYGNIVRCSQVIRPPAKEFSWVVVVAVRLQLAIEICLKIS